MEHQEPEHSAQQARPGLVRWLLFRVGVALIILVLLAFAGAGFVGFLAYQHVTQPGVAGENVQISIPDGSTGRAVARILAENGLVEHELLFLLALKLDNAPAPIRSGRYVLPKGLSSLELLAMLKKGAPNVFDPSQIPDDLKVTVPEGLTIAQAARLFDDPQAFIQAASDTGLLTRIGVAAPSLEGFLMPNTYFFEKKPTEREVVERMVNQFKKEVDALLAQTPLPEGRSLLEVVTVASLVEEEAKVPDERPDVAAVVYNRLEKGMPLQMDSTLQYVLNKYGQRLLYSDRDVDSPYNTYKNQGLPPGPISNPGIASIRAALQPSQTDYIYFVSNADGRTHTFSSSDVEHVRAVRKFRQEIAPQRRAEDAQ